MKRALISLLLGAASARRQLFQTDLHYGLDGFNTKYATRAPKLFSSEDHFHERLFEHESSLPEEKVQVYVVSLAPGVHPDLEMRKQLEDTAKVTIDAVMDGDLMMHGTRAHAMAMRELPEVRTIVPLLPELKLTPHFDAMLPKNATVSLNLMMAPLKRHEHLRQPSAALAEAYTQVLRARCEEDEAWRARPSCTRSPPLGVVAAGDDLLVAAQLSPDDAHAVAQLLAEQAEVHWVEPHPEYRVMNQPGAQIVQAGSTALDGTGTVVQQTPIWDMGIHGEEEIIGCGDSGLDTGHCFFEEATGGAAADQNYGPNHRKVVGYTAFADNAATGQADHGTHVVGSILGESSTPGANGEDEKGVAYAAKVSFFDIGPGAAPGLQVPNNLLDDFYAVDYANGARIHTNSWGANINVYTSSAAQTDAAMYQSDDLVILFAAGNSGGDGEGSIGSPATCKNCVTVGASENTDGTTNRDGDLALFSSIGMAVGNRYKPDVVAPGFFVTSANSNAAGDCPTTSMAGTSMATPITAGATALIRQYLRQGYFPTGQKGNQNGEEDGVPQYQGAHVPSGALMKAMLVASGQKMLGTFTGGAPANLAAQPYPNLYDGFGRIQLDHVLFADDPVNGVNPGERLLIVDGATATLTQGESQVFIVSTAASDPILGTALKVVLVWTDPPGQPQVQNPLVNNLDLTVEHGGTTYNGNGAVDTTNTVEAVLIADVAAQSVTITVTGTSVVQPQKFALVVTGPLDVTSPPPASPAPPPPKPPRPPPAPIGDQVVLGISLPLLLIALAGGGGFFFKRLRGGGGGGGAGAGGGPKMLKPLPAGWKLHTDPTTGSPFYVNDLTGERTWTPPVATAPTAKADLPPGWRASTDPNTGQTYYINEKTSTSQWDKPAMAGGATATADVAVAMTAPAPSSGLPPGWQTGTDPASGRTYWFNEQTKASQWTPP